MRILIYSMNYWPEMTGIGRYSGEMASWFAKKGHEVIVVCSQPYYPNWHVFDGYKAYSYSVNISNQVKIIRCPLWVPKKVTGIKRIIHLLTFTISSFPVVVYQCIRKPGVVFCVEPPFFTAITTIIGSTLFRIKSIIHIQDFEIDAAIATDIIKSKKIAKLALSIEKYLLKQFTLVTTISNSMASKLLAKGIDEEKIKRIPNWVDTKRIKPTSNSNNIFRKKLNISKDKFVVLYSGNMGKKQGLDLIIQVANSMKKDKEVLFVVSGDGAVKKEFVGKASYLKNIICIGLQPEKDLCQLLNLANVHLLPMLKGTEDLVMPSKLGNMLSSGKPIIATAEKHGEIAEIMSEAGFVVNHGSTKEVVCSIKKLLNDPDLQKELGNRARLIAEQRLEMDSVLTNAEKFIISIL